MSGTHWERLAERLQERGGFTAPRVDTPTAPASSPAPQAGLSGRTPEAVAVDLEAALLQKGLRLPPGVLEEFVGLFGPARTSAMLRLDPELLTGSMKRLVAEWEER